MALVNGNQGWRSHVGTAAIALTIALSLASPALRAQSSSGQTSSGQSSAGQTQSQPPANSQSQDIPDTPSTVQPPEPPKPALPAALPPGERPANEEKSAEPIPFPGDTSSSSKPAERQTPPDFAPEGNVPTEKQPRNQINPQEDLFTIVTRVNYVQVPVMVKDTDGRRVDGLLPKDFTLLENGKKQTLSYFSSDPFELSVAIVLDVGMPDVALQKVNQTYSSLVGAFSPYDEVALYTYSATVSQISDFSRRSDRLTAVLNEMKLVRGHNNGGANLGGPMSGGPTVNGAPVGGPTIAPVNTPPREAHVLNDAILRAALDLSKREKTRRKVIFVISDGKELGSTASYREVLKLLESRDIQVKAVVVDSGAIPVYKQIEKFRIKGMGYSDILPKYTVATGGGLPLDKLSRNAIEDAYAELTSEARNQYMLAYTPKAVTGSSSYRTIEVLVDKKGLKISAKDGYYAIPSAR